MAKRDIWDPETRERKLDLIKGEFLRFPSFQELEEKLQAETIRRKKTEEALLESEKKYQLLMEYSFEMLDILQKLKGQIGKEPIREIISEAMVSGLAHDLRNPISIIHSCAQFCLETEDLTPSMEENFKMILENTKRTNQLIKKFLEFSKLELHYKPVNINEMVKRMWRSALIEVRTFQGCYEEQLSEELPEIVGDPENLERVFLNLFLNALQAISPKGKVMVQTRFDSPKKMVEINIINDGPRIPENYKSRIFNPFFSTKEGGTGLGLYLCRIFIQQHKGEIFCDSKDGWGTKFTVRLPVG